MNILVTGGTGLIGSAFITNCKDQFGESVHFFVLTRNASHSSTTQTTYINSLTQIENEQSIDVVLNLAGAPVADARWTENRKQILIESRIALTNNLVEWLATRDQKPHVMISASAVGWYGDGGEQFLDEDSRAHPEFTHELCNEWEESARKAEALGVRVCIVRIGLVLSKSGGFLSRMLLPFKLGLGGPLGQGKQYMPWIHIEDLLGIFSLLIKEDGCQGVYNAVSPSPVSNNEFTAVLARTLGRPAFFRVPAFVLKVLLGEMSRLLLTGQRALPTRLEATGYKFKYSNLRAGMEDVVA